MIDVLILLGVIVAVMFFCFLLNTFILIPIHNKIISDLKFPLHDIGVIDFVLSILLTFLVVFIVSSNLCEKFTKFFETLNVRYYLDIPFSKFGLLSKKIWRE